MIEYYFKKDTMVLTGINRKIKEKKDIPIRFLCLYRKTACMHTCTYAHMKLKIRQG